MSRTVQAGTGFDLLGLLDGTVDRLEQADRAAAQLAELRTLWTTRRRDRPDGLAVPAGQDWCGRCGQNTFGYGLTINHDLGYLGCPVDVDPTWSRYECRGFRSAVGYPSHTLTIADLCDRWDRQFFPDCTCGHPWGVHAGSAHPTGFGCHTYCGCSAYRDSTN